VASFKKHTLKVKHHWFIIRRFIPWYHLPIVLMTYFPVTLFHACRRRIPLSVILATLVGMCLRFYNLSGSPLWIDEALLGEGYLKGQEFIGNLLVVHNDFWFRFPYALAGTLTIPAVYFVTKNRQAWVSWLIAVFPLFVFWSRLARPYSLAGLFVVLAWRWWWFMIPGILTTPVALLGIRLTKKYHRALIFTGVAGMLYYIRPDVQSSSDYGLSFFLDQPRLWYVPLLGVLLYTCDYLLPFLFKRFPVIREWLPTGVVDLSGSVRGLEESPGDNVRDEHPRS
jgi:hypothetical protein